MKMHTQTHSEAVCYHHVLNIKFKYNTVRVVSTDNEILTINCNKVPLCVDSVC